MEGRRKQAADLRRQIEWTLARAVDPTDVLPMLHRLSRLAGDGSDDSLFANLHLAELLVERDPWRAALFARRLLAHRPDDDRGWATLALCQTMLGNYRAAAAAYHRALSTSPGNPWYAHNLGHLLDVALGRASDAIGWLARAYQTAERSAEVAASYAHALARAGRMAEARKVLVRAMKRASSRELSALLRWVEQGAPADRDHPLPRPAPVHALAARRSPATEGAATGRQASSGAGKRASRAPRASEVEAVLARGLASLPLDAKQRARARALARDASARFQRGPVESIAAAVAYAIVFVDHVPLTQADVAACFRVGVASLRGRFAELRAHLDLCPGDTRYATLRRR
jgi:tetratricopeptide (TPR) repeat protein